ncbi:hypothetical protein CgunFtcFv8_012111 [Champsocephalus gunnari]|uniref:Uncharacterized protein n=1 Tax=Champsocephalus gunnari TaxID=52237 RepID=A0AAN8D800_CHAGU|nr:hypothetical protein CgunFtcFv8_012111 [Champsocephalus gunnari]
MMEDTASRSQSPDILKRPLLSRWFESLVAGLPSVPSLLHGKNNNSLLVVSSGSAQLERKHGEDGKRERRVHEHLQVHVCGVKTEQRNVKRRGKWITAAGAARPPTATVTASECGGALPTAPANHACYWAGSAEAEGTPKLFLFFFSMTLIVHTHGLDVTLCVVIQRHEDVFVQSFFKHT